MTPLLDVVFQLITFFMLVFRISGENFDQRVKLPVAGSARPVEGKRALEDRLVLNVNSDGHLLWQGESLDPERARRKLDEQGRLVRLNLKISGQEVGPGEALPTTVVLRADRRIRFAELYEMIVACQANGFIKFDLKAMNTEGIGP